MFNMFSEKRLAVCGLGICCIKLAVVRGWLHNGLVSSRALHSRTPDTSARWATRSLRDWKVFNLQIGFTVTWVMHTWTGTGQNRLLVQLGMKAMGSSMTRSLRGLGEGMSGRGPGWLQRKLKHAQTRQR
ncbi:hypothetical protein K438DRAFT_1757300 [Mycena galopus ATCC 62051]|nr:hypothetical protein K438DRAFT_1757300 [Mycena galopus ATCC 62051]